MKYNNLLTITAITAVGTLAAMAVDVKLNVVNDTEIPRKAGSVTSGIPFAKGAVTDIAKLSASADGKPLPAQFALTSKWEDGSVRWALMDTQVDVPANGRTEIAVRDDGRNAAPAAPVAVKESGSVVTLTTGGTVVTVDKSKSDFLSVALDGKPRLSGGRGLVVRTVVKTGEKEVRRSGQMIKMPTFGSGEEVVAKPPTRVVVEQAGPLRAVVAVHGTFGKEVHNGLLDYTVRITLAAGQRQAKLQVWVENNGAMGYHIVDKKNPVPRTAQMEWFHFDNMAFELGLMGGATKVASDGVESTNGKFKVLQICHLALDKRRITRDGMGPFSLNDFEYVTSSGAEELKRGKRTDGILRIEGAAGVLTTAINKFWENYEKAIEVDGNALRYWLWPSEGQWPRERHTHWQGLYDDELLDLPRQGFYHLPGSVHKGHEIILDFTGGTVAQTKAEMSSPLYAFASPEYYANSDAVPGFITPPGVAKTGDSEGDEKITAWENMYASVVDPANASSLYAARAQSRWNDSMLLHDTTYWYGWLDFGDIPSPGKGPTSLDSDWLWVMMVGAMRTGDVGFMRLGKDMAQHRIDVDQLWSDRDMPHVRGLQRAGGNFPALHTYRLYRAPTVQSNYLAGMAMYALLTGDAKALEACRRNAEGLKEAWKYVQEKRPWAGPQHDMAAVGWAMHSYAAMYELTGNRTWLDEALGLFNTLVVDKWKTHGPHLHREEQISSQSYIEDDIRYCYAIANLCLLHKLTGNEEVLRLIEEGSKKEFPENFFSAPLFLADLRAYAALVTGNADLAEEAVENWIEASPESKSPIVFDNASSTWVRDRGMHMRAGNILQYYFWKNPAK